MIIEINTVSSTPIYQQLRDKIIIAIATRKLRPNETLPSVRRLAADLGINFHTVNKAYTILSDEGYLVIDRRKGAIVATEVKAKEIFSYKLSQQLSLCAAEAICHDLSEQQFIQLCQKHYTEIREEENENE